MYIPQDICVPQKPRCTEEGSCSDGEGEGEYDPFEEEFEDDDYGEKIHDAVLSEMSDFIVSDGRGERWGQRIYQPTEELQHLMTAYEREAAQEPTKIEAPRKRPRHTKPFHHLQAQKDLRKKRSAMAKEAENYRKKMQAQKASISAPMRKPTTPASSTPNRFQDTSTSASWNWMGIFNSAARFVTPKPRSVHSASQRSEGTERKRTILDAIQWDSD